MPNKYLIVSAACGYLTAAGVFSHDRTKAVEWCEADKDALMARWRKTCFACPA